MINSADLLQFFYEEINTARTNHPEIIQHLEKRQFIENDEFKHSVVHNVRFRTEEGKDAVNKAIQSLKLHQKTKPLILSNALCQCAYQVGLEIQKSNNAQDLEPYHSKINTELEKMGVDHGWISIVIDYGFKYDPQIIPSMVVDDGDEKRTKQVMLLSSETKYVGISVHEDEEYDYLVVFLFAGHIVEPVEDTKCQCSIF